VKQIDASGIGRIAFDDVAKRPSKIAGKKISKATAKKSLAELFEPQTAQEACDMLKELAG